MRRLILAFALVILVATPAAAATVTVTSDSVKVLFLRPNLDPVPDVDYAAPDSDRAGRLARYQTTGLRDEIDTLIQASEPGSTLYGSVYTFSDRAITGHLLAAHDRGVKVRLLIEMCTGGDPAACRQSAEVDQLVAGLPAWVAGAAGSWVKRCFASCAGGGVGVNHNKFWVFSALADERTDVTVVASNNPTLPQQQMFQNLVVVSGNAALATAYRRYVDRKLAVTGTGKSYETGHSDAGPFRLWFSPRNSPSTAEDNEIATSFNPQSARHDIFAAAIDDVQCSANATDDVIRLAMWGFQQTRAEVIDALGDKVAAGCTVEVATGEHEDAVDDVTARGIGVYAMDPGGCRQSFFDVGTTVNTECPEGSIHSKYLLVQGVSRKDNTPHRYVYTGSHNLTNGALRKNDETLMRIDDATVYDGYVADFAAIRRAAVTIAPSRYPEATYATANQLATGDQHQPAVAAHRDAAGRHVSVVAFSSGSVAGTGNEIRLCRFVDGVRQSEVVVRTGGATNWNYRTPDVGLAANGDAVVVWADDGNGNGGYEIRSRRVHPDGTVSPVVAVNARADGDQSSPSIAVLPDGRFGVAWQDRTTAGASSIRYASFSATDTRLSPLSDGFDVPVQATAGGTYRKPDLAINAAGDTAVAWEDDADGNGGYSIRARTGEFPAAFGTLVAVHTGALSDGQQLDPAVAVGESGTWYAAWTDSYPGRTGYDGNPQSLIYLRGFTGATAAFAARTVSGPIYRWAHTASGGYGLTTQTAYQSDRVGRQAHPDLAVDGSGNAVVTWQESGQSAGLSSASSGTEVWARGVGPTGTTENLFPDYRLSVFTANRQEAPAVGVDQAGYLTVCYVDDWDGNGGTQLKIRYGLRNCAQTC
ncbi:phosphatidylserine/phosphatidylglycerophosphate/cardiolipin synthase family protein [Micromonospora sp. NPDC049836]|uniref:phosphatidylserine/phosphatidylglycerophosphate/ cardiolipin synthase family protein n=1 Tax=Micromonospora sp. NPDC049836 TaxID=3364274 RepID=UPI003796038A